MAPRRHAPPFLPKYQGYGGPMAWHRSPHGTPHPSLPTVPQKYPEALPPPSCPPFLLCALTGWIPRSTP